MNEPNYFRHVLGRLRSRNEIPTGFIDVGAHFGETQDEIRLFFPTERIVSFEANPYCEQILKQRGMEYVIGLLGSETKEKVPFFVNPTDLSSTGCSIFKEKTQYFANADSLFLPMYRLDEVVPIEANLNFLKMDVQGAEIEVLKGGEKLLPSIKWIYTEMSFSEYNEGAPLFGEVFDYIRSSGYGIVDMCDFDWVNGKLNQCNVLFERV